MDYCFEVERTRTKFKGTGVPVKDKTDKSVKVRIAGRIIEFFTEDILKLYSRGSNLIFFAEIRKAWPPRVSCLSLVFCLSAASPVSFTSSVITDGRIFLVITFEWLVAVRRLAVLQSLFAIFRRLFPAKPRPFRRTLTSNLAI